MQQHLEKILAEQGQALLPRWVTFAGSMMVCMGAALSLVAVTARGTQTAGVEEGEDTRKCKNLRALCRFLCTRPSGTTCWRAMLHRVVILGTASLVSTGLSLLVSNLTADDPESMRTTIRVIVAEVLGLEDMGERNKREAVT